MVDIVFVTHGGERRTVSALAGQSVMQAALDHGVSGILADCGGAMSCATCHVHIPPAWQELVGKASPAEVELLEMAIDPDETSRLSCQITIAAGFEGLEVNLPASQL
jgi:2Fe-2S ferredoxin